jgi:hypothetical protein
MAMVMRDSRAAVLAALVVAVTIAARAHAVHIRTANVMVVDTSGAAVPDSTKQDIPAR